MVVVLVITLEGKLNFNPPPLIPSHVGHRIIILDITPGYESLYRWFIKKELGLNLIRPVREGHVTVVSWYESDSISKSKWEEVEEVWGNKKIPLEFHPPKSDEGVPYWWFPIKEEFRVPLHQMRLELGLPERPKSGLHLTIGTIPKYDLRTKI